MSKVIGGGWGRQPLLVAVALLVSAAVAGQEPGMVEQPDSAGTPQGFRCPAAALPPIETFMQIGSCGSPQISDDGAAVFFISSMSGVDQVYELLGSGWPYQLTVFPDGVDFYRISYSGRWIVVGASEGGSEQSNLYLIDSDTDFVTPLKTAQRVQHGSPVWSRDERFVYFRSNEESPKDFYIYSLEVATKTVEKVWEHPGWNEPVAVSTDGTWLLVSSATSNVNNDLYIVDLKVGGAVLVTQHEGDYAFENGRLSPDLKYVYFITNLNDDGTMRVARKAPPHGAIEFINPESAWDTEEMDLSDDGEMLAWIENAEGYSVLRTLDLVDSLESELKDMRGVISGMDLSNVETAVLTFESGSVPPDVWKYDAEDGELDRLTRSTLAGVDQVSFVEPELVHYRSFDGLGIPAFLYLPSGWAGEQIPFIMDIHGGPEGQFRPGFVRNFQYFLTRGFGVLAPNIRGSRGYGRDYVQMDDYRNRQNSIRDICEGAQWLVDRGYARPGKIGIKGGSYGGYATLAALVECPETFGAGVDDIGIANFVTFLTNTAPYRRALREAEYGPLSDAEFLREISPLTHAAKIRAPLLIMHGANDPRVPVSEARHMAAAITAQGGVVDTLIFSDEGHGAAKLGNRLVSYRKMADFLEQHLK
jgi:dipeptidyl aminopeptidase/acylaminoacyl peptidase